MLKGDPCWWNFTDTAGRRYGWRGDFISLLKACTGLYVGTVSSIDAEEEEEAEHGKVFHDFSFKTSRVVT